MYQYTSLVYTDAPLQVKKLSKQQLRWARGSQYNTLRMLPWMLGHAPVLAIFFLADIILPFLLFGDDRAAGSTGRSPAPGINLYQAILETYTGLTRLGLGRRRLMIVSSVLSMAIRQIRHLHEKPSDFLRLPVFIIVSTLFLMPIRLLGFLRMAHASGWGTRAGAYAGGERRPDRRARETRPPGRPTSSTARPTGRRCRRRRAGCPTAPLLDRDRRRPVRARRAVATAPVGCPARRRRLNPLAAIPYAIALAIFALEALVYV